MKISYQTRNLDEIDADFTKPVLFSADKGFPYHLLSPWEFEDLTYFVFKQVIELEGNWNGFDSVESLGGIKDKGRDCVLKREGYNLGVIQCKHSANNDKLTKTKFAKEILKFFLYSLNEPELIPQPKNFIYFIFSSAGTDKTTSNLVQGFNSMIFRESNLELWVNQVIIEHSSIRNLKNYKFIQVELDFLLTNVKVKDIRTKDFDHHLQKEYNRNLISKFFSIQPILDTSHFNEILDDKLKLNLKYDEAADALKLASYDIKEITNYFGVQVDSHLHREETQKLLNWILMDLPGETQGLSVLEANAGLGKTVVLKDLYDILIHQNIPVLAIKADKFYAEDRLSLEKKIFGKEGYTIIKVINALQKKHQKIVILIDQLDALSQTLSTQRKFLYTYNQLIRELLNYRDVRIIVSIRSFDLQYDSDLKYYSSNKFFRVLLKPLKEVEVKKVLTLFGISNPPSKLLQLLTVPSHLNTFCKLDNKRILTSDYLKTQKDLYDVLWEDLLYKAGKNRKILTNLLFSIAEKMYQQQRITVPNSYHDEFFEELKLLKSNYIIFEDNKGIQFFHQTFYDYVFSKQFVAQGNSLLSYLKSNGQSLYVRQVVKMVIEYIREFNHAEYIKVCNAILSSSKIRFHLKLLVINSLSIVSNPSRQEKQLFQRVIYPKFILFEAFISSVASQEWVEYLIDEGILIENINPPLSLKDKVKDSIGSSRIPFISKWIKTWTTYNKKKEIRQNLVYRCIIRNIHSEPTLQVIIPFLHKISKKSTMCEFVRKVLIHVENWQAPELLFLFERNFQFQEKNAQNGNFWYYQLLGKIFKSHPKFVLGKLEIILNHVVERDAYSQNLKYEEKTLLEDIFREDSKIVFDFLFEYIKKRIAKDRFKGTYDKIGSPLFQSLSFLKAGSLNESEDDVENFIFHLLTKYLSSESRRNKKKYLTIFEANRNSNSIVILQLFLISLKENPSVHHQEAFEFLQLISQKNGFAGYDDSFQLHSRILLGSIFPFVTPEQKIEFMNLIFSITHVMEKKVFEDRERKKYHLLKLNSKKEYLFILAIGLENIEKHPPLKKRYQELYRKFGDTKEIQLDGQRVMSHVVGPPLKQGAYDKMNFPQWKKSMLKYNDNYRNSSFDSPGKGGKYEHANAFREIVTKNSKEFFPYLKEIYECPEISVDYKISGLQGLVVGKYHPEKVKQLHEKLFGIFFDDSNLLTYLSITEYIIANGLIDKKIFDYLCNLVKYHKNPSKEYNPDNPRLDSFQTVRAVALSRVIQCYENKTLGEEIFEVVEFATEDKQPSVKVAILSNVAFLNHLDKERSFSIFKRIVEDCEVKVMAHSFWSADYFKNIYFSEMHSYFLRIINNKELHKDGVVIIAKSWVSPKKLEGSFELLELAAKQGDDAIGAILRVAEGNLFDESGLNPKCLSLLFRFLGIKSKEISSFYSGLILRKFKPNNFQLFYPFLQAYVKSSHAEEEPRYFFDYLTRCASSFPLECLELMQKTVHFNNTDIQRRGFFDKEPVNVVLSIYSSLNRDFKKNRKPLNQTLDLFDDMLQNDSLRNQANFAIDSI